jgi:hypothetical protein
MAMFTFNSVQQFLMLTNSRVGHEGKTYCSKMCLVSRREVTVPGNVSFQIFTRYCFEALRIGRQHLEWRLAGANALDGLARFFPRLLDGEMIGAHTCFFQ